MKQRAITLLLVLVLVTGLLPAAVLAVTDSEPNDTLATAQEFTMGETISGEISEIGDYDWYKFTLEESGRLSLTMKAYMKYYTLHIYDTSGAELWYTDENTWNSSVGFRTDTHTIDLTEGTYYLRVTGDYFIGSSGRSTGNYALDTSFTSANVTETEDNNNIAHANPVALDGTIRGQIAVNDRNDYHQFTLAESGRLTLEMTAYLKYYTLHIYDTSGTELWYTDENTWNSSVGFRTDTYTIDLTEGTYYLRVTGDYFIGSSGRSTGNYTLDTSFTSANVTETEDNNNIAHANPVALDGTIRGQIAVNDRNDYHQFTLAESGRLTLEMTAYLKYYTLHIYDTSGTELWYTDENTWNSSVGFRTDTYTIDLTEGTYYLRVTGDYFIGSSGRSTGNYTLDTSFTGANATETEGNNCIADANHTVLNVPIHGQIAVNDRNDYHQFTLAKSTRLTLIMTSYMQYYTLNLYDETGTDLWSKDERKWDPSTGYRTDIFSIDLTAGTYYLRVTGDYFLGSSSRSTGTYQLLLNTPNPFTDVPAGAFYADPVLWAVEKGITTGASATSFNPNGQCQRAQVVTFLHRAAENPEPSSVKNPFTDVKSSDFFYKPVLWAVEKGITNGISATKFGSYDVCNRAAVVTFLWRAAGEPEPQSTANPFVDVKPGDFFYKPVLWAIENDITNGIDATHFGPTSPCNRAQVVTFLYRAYN